MNDVFLILGGILAGIGAIFGALAAAFWRGKKVKNLEQTLRDAKDYRDTRRRIDDAINDDFGPDHVREWLRQRGDKSSRNL
jgi:gas vesicle protein